MFVHYAYDRLRKNITAFYNTLLASLSYPSLSYLLVHTCMTAELRYPIVITFTVFIAAIQAF